MKISGITTVDSWKPIHPLSNTTIVGVMTALKPSFSQFAKDLKKKDSIQKLRNNASGRGKVQPRCK